jgi:Sodium:dicarboxylate symporter family
MLRVLAVAMVASTSGAGVPVGAFVKVPAMLTVVAEIPVTSLALLLGVDKLMSECRALTNVIGNGVVAISRGEGELDAESLRKTLREGQVPEIRWSELESSCQETTTSCLASSKVTRRPVCIAAMVIHNATECE